MAEEHGFVVTIEHLRGLEFKVAFDGTEAPELLVGEAEASGGRSGPNASRLLAAAVGNCLTASLLFCLQRSRLEVAGARARVSARTGRNERGRLRVGGFAVRIELPVPAAEREKLERCLALFEDYCVVTASVRQGIPVGVEVVDSDGGVLFASDGREGSR